MSTTTASPTKRYRVVDLRERATLVDGMSFWGAHTLVEDLVKETPGARLTILTDWGTQ